MTRWLREYLFISKHMKACRDLARHAEANRNSFKVRDFTRRRAAMLQHTRGTHG